jgi:hypothetical protein
MPCVELEPTTPASERAKTMHALDRTATVTGNGRNSEYYFPQCYFGWATDRSAHFPFIVLENTKNATFMTMTHFHDSVHRSMG